MNCALLALLMALPFHYDETLILPPQTKEIKDIIVKLGHEDFRVREKADAELREMGYKALAACYKASQENPDAEIRMRTENIYNSYFVVFSNDKDNLLPAIWYIDEEIRFPKGFTLDVPKADNMGSTCKSITEKDIAAEYYQLAVIKLKVPNHGWWDNENAAQEATRIYVKEQLLSGRKKEDLKKMLDQAAKNYTEKRHYLQTDNLGTPVYDWYSKPPGPMIKKEDYRDPTYGGGGP
jgi:hypothetical protein